MQRIQYAKTKSDVIAKADGSFVPREKRKRHDDKGNIPFFLVSKFHRSYLLQNKLSSISIWSYFHIERLYVEHQSSQLLFNYEFFNLDFMWLWVWHSLKMCNMVLSISLGYILYKMLSTACNELYHWSIFIK